MERGEQGAWTPKRGIRRIPVQDRRETHLPSNAEDAYGQKSRPSLESWAAVHIGMEVLRGWFQFLHHIFDGGEIRLRSKCRFFRIGVTHGAEYAGKLGEEGFVVVQTAGVEKAHELSSVGKAGGKSGVHAAAADEAGRFHEKLNLCLHIGFSVAVAQGRAGNREYAFETDDLRRLDDEGAGTHDGRDEQEAGADLIGHIDSGRLTGRERAHSRAAAVDRFQDTAPGKGAEGRSEGRAVD